MARAKSHAIGEQSPDPGRTIVGASPPMAALRMLVGQAADARAAVLIVGETGTGKTLVAQCVHLASLGNFAPLVTVHGPALTGEPAAFSRLFARARGGTLLLDEIGDMPLADQDAFLAARLAQLERKAGAVRVLATTRADLVVLVQRGRFREELHRQLTAFNIEVPPLREHVADIAELAALFLERAVRGRLWPDGTRPRLSREGLVSLAAHPWPGNVRELENVIQRVCYSSDGGPVGADAIRAALAAWPCQGPVTR
jgi:DNA-binding NtrC family response regulator